MAIGVFDSGVGGLSVWREIVRQLPHEDTLYVADQAHVPYGPRSADEIRSFCHGIAEFLIERACKAIVVACNTASAAALKSLRERFPGMLILGMEPAVKPAVAITRSKVVGILATPATFQGRLFQATAGRYASGVTLVNQVCDGLAELVESGQLHGPEAQRMLRGFLAPVLEAGADTIVLACTHYPFVISTIRHIAGPRVNVIDPAPAIARHPGDVVAARGISAYRDSVGTHRFHSTGDARAFESLLVNLVQVASPVSALQWYGRHLAHKPRVIA